MTKNNLNLCIFLILTSNFQDQVSGVGFSRSVGSYNYKVEVAILELDTRYA